MAAPVPVYQVVLRLGCGGLEKMVVHLARTLDPARFRVTVCCLEDPGELAVELEGTGVPVISLGKQGFDLRTFGRLARRLRAERVRVVHTHNANPHLYGTVAARMAGAPVVLHTRHGPRENPGLHRVMRHPWLWRMTNAIVAVSDDTAEWFEQRHPIAPEKLVTIANGVPVPVIRPEDRADVRSEFGIPAGATTVGIVARLAPEKEHRTLVAAFTQVRKSLPDAHLLIVGDGLLRGELERQVTEAGIAPQVHFTGFRSDVHRTLAAMDLFVLCSRFEGTSLTLLEAMGARLPIVATAVGGNPAVLGGEENACLVPAQDPEALACGILEVLADPERARAAAARAYARMTKLFGVETMARQYEDLYERLLCSRQTARSLTSPLHETPRTLTVEQRDGGGHTFRSSCSADLRVGAAGRKPGATSHSSDAHRQQETELTGEGARG